MPSLELDTLALIVLAAACQVTAVWAWTRRRLRIFFVGQFAAGHLLSHWASAVGEPAALALGRALLVPAALLLVSRCTHRVRWIVTIAALTIGSWMLVDTVRRVHHEALAPRPIVAGDQWDPAFPLRLLRARAQLQPLRPDRIAARLSSQLGEIRLEWPFHGGAETLDVLLENAGRATDYEVEEGRVELFQESRSRVRARCHFDQDGGACRLRMPDSGREPTRVFLIGGTRGDHAALRRLLDLAEERGVDVVVSVGDLVTEGSYAGQLAVRDLIDAVGERSLFVPGPGEVGARGVATFRSVFGAGDAAVRQGAIVALAADSSTRPLDRQGIDGLGFMTKLAATLGVPFLVTSRPVLEIEAGRSAADRDELLAAIRTWLSPVLMLALSSGAGSDAVLQGLREVTVGVSEDHVEGVWFRVAEGRCSDLERFSVERSKTLGRIESEVRELIAVTREHPGLAGHGSLALAVALLGITGVMAGMSHRGRGWR